MIFPGYVQYEYDQTNPQVRARSLLFRSAVGGKLPKSRTPEEPLPRNANFGICLRDLFSVVLRRRSFAAAVRPAVGGVHSIGGFLYSSGSVWRNEAVSRVVYGGMRQYLRESARAVYGGRRQYLSL